MLGEYNLIFLSDQDREHETISGSTGAVARVQNRGRPGILAQMELGIRWRSAYVERSFRHPATRNPGLIGVVIIVLSLVSMLSLPHHLGSGEL